MKHAAQPFPVRFVPGNSETQPRRMFGEAADQNAGAAEAIKYFARGIRAHQPEQRRAADDFESCFCEKCVQPFGRRA